MNTRTLMEFEFERIGELRVERSASGEIAEYVFDVPPKVRRNAYGHGPFCRFRLSGAGASPGVYAVLVGGELKYVGESLNLAQRFGPAGYGEIQARNCHSDGQSTNCKINANVLAATRRGLVCEVWFHSAPTSRKAVESVLLRALAPPWNSGRTFAMTGGRDMKPVEPSQVSPSNDFGRALEEILTTAQQSGRRAVTVSAAELHRRVGGYPGRAHRMPVCCAAMRKALREGDSIIAQPPKGNGPKLTIEYALPRRSKG